MRSPRQALRRSRRLDNGRPALTLGSPRALTLRMASAEDALQLVRLAALDSSRAPEAPVLTAALDGEICVAVSLVDLHTIADPFRFTGEVRAIAIARANQLRAAAAPQALRRLSARGRAADPSPRPHGAV